MAGEAAHAVVPLRPPAATGPASDERRAEAGSTLRGGDAPGGQASGPARGCGWLGAGSDDGRDSGAGGRPGAGQPARPTTAGGAACNSGGGGETRTRAAPSDFSAGFYRRGLAGLT